MNRNFNVQHHDPQAAVNAGPRHSCSRMGNDDQSARRSCRSPSSATTVEVARCNKYLGRVCVCLLLSRGNTTNFLNSFKGQTFRAITLITAFKDRISPRAEVCHMKSPNRNFNDRLTTRSPPRILELPVRLFCSETRRLKTKLPSQLWTSRVAVATPCCSHRLHI